MLVIGFYLPATAQEEAAEEPAATEAPAETGTAAETAGEAVPPGSQIVEGDYDLWDELKKGGTTMVALGLLVVGALAFSLERLWSVRESKFAPNRFFKKILPLWKKGQFNEVAKLCRKNNSVLSQVVLYMARNYRAPYEILMHAAGDIGARELKRQFGKTFPIAVIAMLAPLLGLLGTVLGMIGAFRTVAIAGEMGDASLLAEDIGKALITTATGLIIAIPTLAIYHYFRQRISYFATEVEEQLDELTQPWLRSPEEVKQWQKNIQPVEDDDDYGIKTTDEDPEKPAQTDPNPSSTKAEGQPAAS
jgi:biopolymer transport protein ExbB